MKCGLNEWNGQHDKAQKIAKESASMKETFKRKTSNWCWTAVLFVAYSSKPARMFLSIEFRIVQTANILPSSRILLLHLEVLFVWFIWAVNLVCLTTLLSLDGLFAVYLLSSSATEKKYLCTGTASQCQINYGGISGALKDYARVKRKRNSKKRIINRELNKWVSFRLNFPVKVELRGHIYHISSIVILLGTLSFELVNFWHFFHRGRRVQRQQFNFVFVVAGCKSSLFSLET